jgi:16S rRNA (cytosine967-C5)-methyltransferase
VSAEKPRQIAVRVLKRHMDGSGWLESLLDSELASSHFSPADRGLTQELAFGAVRWQATLDWLIARKTAGRAQKPLLQILLRLGLYQLFWLDRVPDHAAVNESVQLARELGLDPQSGFVNAVLRGCLRERDSLERELAELKVREPHLGYSHPQWICDRWERRWGQEKLTALLDWNNSPPPVFLRVNTLKSTPEELAAQFESEGVRFEPRQFGWAKSDLIFHLKSPPPLATLPSFQQGRFYIQDPSTLLAVGELDPRPGETVLDLCAAPGGKTTFIAQQMEDRGRIIAQDLDSKRLELIRENCTRLGVTCVQITPIEPPNAQALGLQFDRVLVDAPCSNSGVMRRRVELRWRIQPSELNRLRTVQLDLLAQAAKRLHPGGLLVYSTCSLEPEENSGVVEEFVATHSGFRLESARELIPFVDGVDGAYVARLRKD